MKRREVFGALRSTGMPFECNITFDRMVKDAGQMALRFSYG